MTRLADELLTDSLQGTPGWRIAEEAEEELQARQSQDWHQASHHLPKPPDTRQARPVKVGFFCVRA